ncbi:hypothetical protein [Citreimonas sp.]|uniref:hypothetical protein n=1 Tax=Citreimonas sp. TaxID=3036715 RepID=UPI0035C7F5DD
MLSPVKVSEYAHALYRSLGPRAEAEAARRARNSEQSGQEQDAAEWRRIQQSITQMRGPRET